MTHRAAEFARAASSLACVPFKLRGRDPAIGLDCAGLVAEALRRVEYPIPPLPTYGLRNTDYSFLYEFARSAGFEPVSDAPAIGDIVIVTPGPAQRHLLIKVSGAWLVHAHAGLGRVVLTPEPLPWPVCAVLRLSERD